MNMLVFHKTPSVTVIDNRSRVVKEVEFCRHPMALDITDERITLHQYDNNGFLTQSADPRLNIPNTEYNNSLNGEILRTKSVDAGVSIILKDVNERPSLAVNAMGVLRTWEYESNNLSGRPLSIIEREPGKKASITERFIWAGYTQAERNYNLVGQCVRHYTTAGLNQIDSVTLTKESLSITQQLLPDNSHPDWQGSTESDWKDKLAADIFTTVSTFDATGLLQGQTDAQGNIQRLVYDIAGQLCGSWLKQAGQSEQVVIKSLTYSAAGKKLREEHGNGIVTLYTYEPETLQLIGIKTKRPAGHALGAKVLQDLRYQYDPVGNVIHVRNDAEATRFWRNQKVVPENTYSYDSLYQLVSTTGRELASIGQQSHFLPIPIVPLPVNDNVYTTYTRNYSYDQAGNLTQIKHNASATQNSYTINITVSNISNRAVISTITNNPAQVNSQFDKGGHQNLLFSGQKLFWNTRGELLQVGEDNTSGVESYHYDSDGMRVTKVRSQQNTTSLITQKVIYLSDLEIRTTTNNDALKEELHIIKVKTLGNTQVRVLHWQKGQPEAITNNQLRYSYGNLINSNGLEIDGIGQLISLEEYYPYGGTAVWSCRNQIEAEYKVYRYTNKERDTSGLYYYGRRYYQPWIGRWLSADPEGTIDGLNLFRMTHNNPVTLRDDDGLMPVNSNYMEEAIASTSEQSSLTAEKLLLEELTEAYRNLTMVDGVTVTKSFDQSNDFIRNSTIAYRGVCVPLTAKWLTEREVVPKIDFFSDIQTEGGREEIMHLAVEIAKRNYGIVNSYLNTKGFSMEPIEEKQPENPGLYSISVSLGRAGLHNLALDIKSDTDVTLFDPNYGEFKFNSLNEYNKFLIPYLMLAFSDDVDNLSERNLSYVQYKRLSH